MKLDLFFGSCGPACRAKQNQRVDDLQVAFANSGQIAFLRGFAHFPGKVLHLRGGRLGQFVTEHLDFRGAWGAETGGGLCAQPQRAFKIQDVLEEMFVDRYALRGDRFRARRCRGGGVQRLVVLVHIEIDPLISM